MWCKFCRVAAVDVPHDMRYYCDHCGDFVCANCVEDHLLIITEDDERFCAQCIDVFAALGIEIGDYSY
jgi:hypothetical protein